MRTYTEYKVKLSDSQKSKLASAIRNNSSLTLNDQIPIPKKFFPMVAPFQRSLQKNRGRKSTKLIKPEVEWLSNQQENRLKEDYWDSIGIALVISLVSKMFGSGLQVDRAPSRNTTKVWVPPASTRGEGQYPYASPPFFGSWENAIGAGVKKKSSKKGKGILLGKNSPFNSIPILGAILETKHYPTLICLIDFDCRQRLEKSVE